MEESEEVESFQWDLIWKLKCSQKIRIFLWRLVLNKVATSENLYKRNIIESRSCGVCGAEREDLIHTFLNCKIATVVWNLLGIFSGTRRGDSCTRRGAAAGTVVRSGFMAAGWEADDELDAAGPLVESDRALLEKLNSSWLLNREPLPRLAGAVRGRPTAASEILQQDESEPGITAATVNSSGLRAWMDGHLRSKARIDGLEWPYVFVAALWTIWSKRNSIIFNERSTIPHERELKRDIISLASIVLAWGKSFDGGIIKMANNVMVKWVKPTSGFKLNIDGSFFNMKRMAGIGGLLRDKDGTCISCFMGACTVISPFISELYALHFGLMWASNNGYTDLIIETDSEELHALVKGGGSSTHFEMDSGKLHALVKGGGSLGHYVSMIKECCALLRRLPHFELNHVFREANLCADKLAKEGAMTSSQLVIYTETPDYLWKLITRDRSGYATVRVALDS